MGFVTLTPVSTTTVGSMTVNGAGTADVVLSDGDDATYLTGDVASVPFGAEVELSDGSFPSGARIVAVRGLLRGRRGTAAPVGKLTFGLLRSGQSTGWVRQVSVADTSPADFASTWITSDPYTNPWTVESVQAQSVHLTTEKSARLTEFALEVEYNVRPVGTLDALGTVTDTSSPTVTWAYSDTDNDPQEAFRVRILDGATEVHDSGWVFSSASQYQLPPLANGVTYTTELQVRQSWSGGGTHDSAVDTDTFTLDVTTPAPPGVLDVAYPDEGVVTLELFDNSVSPEPAAEWFSVEYHDGDGNWQTLRGASEVDAGGTLLVADPEVPLQSVRTYRVTALAAPAGQTLASGPTEVSVFLGGEGRFITDPYDPETLNVKVSTREHGRSWSGREQVHYPAGMNVAVVESEPTVAHQSLSVWTLNPADHELLTAAFRNRRTLLYRDRRTTLYFRWVGDRTSQQLGPDATGVDALTGSMVEVARPS